MTRPDRTNVDAPHRHAFLPLLAGGVAIGTLDLLFAIGFWLPHGVRPIRIAQSIASGWLGEASFEGGAASAALGTVSHYFIATMFVVAYYLAARKGGLLLRKPGACGPAYGLLLYLAMNFVVVPLSAAGTPGFGNLAWVAGSIVAHAVFGVMAALFAVAAIRRS